MNKIIAMSTKEANRISVLEKLKNKEMKQKNTQIYTPGVN